MKSGTLLMHQNTQMADLIEGILDRFVEYQIGEMWTGEDMAVINAMREQYEEIGS